MDSLKNAVSISGDFVVDKSHKRPNTGAKDGDLHIAGRNEQIGLPLVAEIMNARDYREAVDLVHSVEGIDDYLKMTGVWRLWFEHPGGPQKQEDNLRRFTSTNPDHVFEIHPVLKVNNIDLISSLKLINGFTPKAAKTAFDSYSRANCTIEFDDSYIKIDSKKMGYNYVEFVMKLKGDKESSDDGVFVSGDVYSTDNEKVTESIRMVFPEDSEAEIMLRTLQKGDTMHVLGIPRVNLNEIANLITNASSSPIEVLLPFEIIIVGLYN